jgi:LysM repeat protein
VDGIAQAPSEAIQITTTASPVSVEMIEIVESDSTATVSEGDCLVRDDWRQSYTVQAGDVLAEIAEDYNLTIDEIAEANCLSDPSRLRIGQVLRIAGEVATPTASAIAFRADAYVLNEGDCTTLRWDDFNVIEVYLVEGETLVDSYMEVCPKATSSYILHVVFLDGTETERELTITVEE